MIEDLKRVLNSISAVHIEAWGSMMTMGADLEEVICENDDEEISLSCGSVHFEFKCDSIIGWRWDNNNIHITLTTGEILLDRISQMTLDKIGDM